MVSEDGDKCSSKLNPGTYIIRSVLSPSLPLNLTRKDTDSHPTVCIWSVVKSPTQRWCIEYGTDGYLIRNADTNHYLSYDNDVSAASSSQSKSTVLGPTPGTRVLGTSHPASWELQQVESYYFIKLASNPSLILDVSGSMKNTGTPLIMWDDFHRSANQRFILERVDDIQPPSYRNKPYVGPVPPGIYWFGQPYYDLTKPAERKGISSWRKLPSVLALGVTSCLPPEDEQPANIHLLPSGDGPWPHQIWEVESGRKGYRIRNLGINAYLSYVDSKLVFDNAVEGTTSVTEWVPKRDPSAGASDVFDV
ncbi:hypothetical protein FRC03_006012 [Tulasnella sp. 419]|nr:hypothetical protein FRC03_006012 [Tulasnella sp. 419]